MTKDDKVNEHARSITLASCDGPTLAEALNAATAWVEHHVAEINALNVFPVPDGDTGSNMWLTLQSAVAEAAANGSAGIGAVAHAASHGALMGARGNSGVILSQILRGIARSLDAKETASAADLAAALSEGAATAYRGVIKPVEGTMLTVARDSAVEAEAAAKDGADVVEMMKRTVLAAQASLARTPSLLPVLAEAGVVDAGGQGYVTFLEGMLRHFSGEALSGTARPATRQPVAVAQTEAAVEPAYGYCTEFIIKGNDIDVEGLRSMIAARGESVLVVGEPSLVKVHLHTFDPGEILSAAVKLGTLHKIKIDNMEEQHREFLRNGMLNLDEEAALPKEEEPEKLAIAVVAVVSGAGLTEVFRSLGAHIVVPGGQTMNPSTSELLQAVEAAPSDAVLLLPNNSNIILTARQVVAITKKQIEIVPTETLPQGIAALMAFNYEADLANNARAMTRALQSVRTIEVTRAVRTVRFDGVEVAEGAPIALVDGQLVHTGDNLAEVAIKALAGSGAETSDLITIYFGEGTTAAEAQDLSAAIQDRWPNVAIEVVDGGQPHYPYMISIE